MDSLYRSIKETPESQGSKNNIEVWEDLVNIKDLVIALVVCSVTTLGGYFLAPNKPPKPLFFGLSGAIIGFVICTIFIKPKRIFIERNQEE
jgi:hypothetical protein